MHHDPKNRLKEKELVDGVQFEISGARENPVHIHDDDNTLWLKNKTGILAQISKVDKQGFTIQTHFLGQFLKRRVNFKDCYKI